MESQSEAEATAARRGARRTWALWGVLALLVVLLAVGGVITTLAYRHRPSRPHSPPHSAPPRKVVASPHRSRPPRAGAAELAFLAPVTPGKPFEGWRVQGISAVFRGSIRVALARGHDRVQLRIVKAGSGPVPPARSGPYAVYYSAKHVEGANSVDAQGLAQALARDVSKNQKLEPPGLKPFRQDPNNDDWL